MAIVPHPTIFLIDDDPAVRDSLKLFLETYGYVVRDFASGSEFLKCGNRAEAGCLVVDMHMPMVSGLDLLEQLAAEKAVPPTVLITGRADPATRHRAVAAGVFEVIEKPFDPAALLTALQGAVDAARPTSPGIGWGLQR
jgi:two-component system, LuxR family, response regulator FixJ